MTSIEKNVLDFLYKWRYALFLSIITILACFIRILFIPIESGDYENFLKVWFDTLKQNGGFLAIKNPIGDYNIPYLTILACLTYLPLSSLVSIKLVSIIFDFFGAIVAALIVKKLTKSYKYSSLITVLTYTIVIFLPTVVLNGSAWAQCDSIYTSFILLSFYLLMDKKYFWSLFVYGIAFSFKLQAIFVLPIFIIIYLINKDFSIFNFLLIPGANLFLSLPALLLGYPLKNLVLIYLNQTNTYHYLVMNFPNIYNLVDNNYYDLLKLPGIIFTVIIIGIFTMTIWCMKTRISNEEIITYALWQVMAMAFFLPSIHDRYLFTADILSIIYFMIQRKNIYIPIFINLASLSTYIIYLFEMPSLFEISSLFEIPSLFEVSSSNTILMTYVYLITLSFFTFQVFKEIFNSHGRIKST